jgi:hypothetical protein
MGYRFIGTEGSDCAGISVASAGDVDNDGPAGPVVEDDARHGLDRRGRSRVADPGRGAPGAA